MKVTIDATSKHGLNLQLKTNHQIQCQRKSIMVNIDHSNRQFYNLELMRGKFFSKFEILLTLINIALVVINVKLTILNVSFYLDDAIH